MAVTADRSHPLLVHPAACYDMPFCHRESPPMPDLPALRAERAALEQSIEARQRELGPDHPDLAGDLRALGRLAHELGDFQDAQSLLHRALALYTESVGAEHPE